METQTTHPNSSQRTSPENKTAVKAWLSDCAFAELKAANTIATNGLRTLTVQQRQRLVQQCEHKIPADEKIRYTFGRDVFIYRAETTRRIYLLGTIRHLKHCHKLIQLTLGLMTPEQKSEWAVVNERAGVTGEGETRANERLAVINKFDELKPTLYPQQETA